MDVLDMKLSMLLDVATRIQSYLSNNSESNEIIDIVLNAADKHNAIATHDTIASEGYTFVIVATDPNKVFKEIVNLIKKANSIKFQTTYNPITIITKLVNREYMLQVGGTRLCYCIATKVPSNYLLKTFACRTIASVKSYYNYVSEESFMIQADKIKELHPQYNYTTKANQVIGGKKQVKTNTEKKKGNIRVNIIARLIEYVRNNPAISIGIIFGNSLDECSSSAINIFYIDHKYKEAIVDYLKLLVADSYSNYTFKAFLHADFVIPYDFRMKKHSCLINDTTTKQATYIANLYNNAMYEPLPCTKSIVQDSFIQLVHPIIKLRMLYIDMYMIEHKTGSAHPINHEKLYQSRMLKAFRDLETYDKSPTWVGFFIDEAYDKIKYNMRMKMSNPIETVLI